MKLQRLKVAELRRFRQPFELADIQPGLNIFSGPNESGKSTLVRALRAAFFERHRSTVVDDLRPYGDSSAAPQVELDFEVDGTPYRLVKRFLARKRCDLIVGQQAFEGQAAEDLLARLLGFQFAAKGASREEHWGIPGLLWINQGAGHELRDAVGHAHDHLRQALDQSVGDVAASGGDELMAQVRRLHDELLTATGKPRAELQRAIDDEARLQLAVADLQQQLATYCSQVDQLNQLRSAQADDARAQPWLAWRQQLATAQQALQAVAALAQDRDRVRDQLRQASGLGQLLAQALVDADQQQQGLPLRQAAWEAAQSRHDQAAALQARCEQAAALHQQRLDNARHALVTARQESLRHNLGRQLADAQARAADLGGLLARAQAEADRSATHKRQAAPLRIAPADLMALRQQQGQLTELQIRQQAVATRLRFELTDNARITLDGQPLTGQGERLLLAGSQVAIAGMGSLQISPGGQDLADLARTQATLQANHRALLQRLGVDTLAEAESRGLAHARHLADAAAADQAAQLLAPKGLAMLQQDLDAAQARQAEASAALARLPPAQAQHPSQEPSASPGQPAVQDDASLALSGAVDATACLTTTSTPAEAAEATDTASTEALLASAERAHDACRADADAATQQWQAARQAMASAASQLDAAQREHDTLKAQLADPQRLASLADKRQALVQASAQQEALARGLADIDQRIAAARPDILQQDVDRLRRSADEAERQHQARDRQIVQLESTLAAAGAQGLEEELASRDSEWTQARQRLDQLRRRANALALLLLRLQQHRQAMTRRLQAPLQQRLDHYLPLLLPSASLQVDEALLPGSLTRPGPQGHETADLASLSFGAREQMGLISRLAYADLLQQAGRPTLIVLDDALVHSDAQRLALMKRVLFDGARRHQVLLFTCHPADWRDMGVPVRALQADP